MAVKLDIIEGSGIRQTRDGIEKLRVAFVTGLVGANSQREYEAINLCPAINSGHPTIPGITLAERSGIAEGFDKVRVNLIYRTPSVDFSGGTGPAVGDPAQIEVGATLQSITTQKDVAGVDLNLVYTITADDLKTHPGINYAVGATVPFVATASIQAPQVFVRYRRRETVSPAENAKLYVGKINSVSVFGDAPKMWLCTQLLGRSTDAGATYMVDYEFQRAYDANGWDVTLRAEFQGTPMSSPVVGTNIKDFTVYPQADFNALAL